MSEQCTFLIQQSGVESPAAFVLVEYDANRIKPADILPKLRNGVELWLKEGAAGPEAWKESSEDFNWGDLANWTQDEDLVWRLDGYGIIDVQIDVINADEVVSYENFDKVFRPAT